MTIIKKGETKSPVMFSNFIYVCDACGFMETINAETTGTTSCLNCPKCPTGKMTFVSSHAEEKKEE